MSFFAELKRRNVFKVGIAYAIVAWLLIQVASILFPTFQAPDWAMRVFALFVILGFPIAIFLAWAYELTPEGIKATSDVEPSQNLNRTSGRRLNHIILGLVVLVVVFVLADNYLFRDTSSSMVSPSTAVGNVTEARTEAQQAALPAVVTSPVRRHYQVLGLTQRLPYFNLHVVVALSSDGMQLVYAVNTETGLQLLHRNLNRLSSQPLPVPGNLESLFFSPDGQWVAVGTNSPGAVYKVSLNGGPPQLLAEGFNGAYVGHWATNGFIYFTGVKGSSPELYRVRDTGGNPKPLHITGKATNQSHTWPYLLPDGTHLLFTVSQLPVSPTGRIALLDLKTGKTRILIQNGYNARYIPTGHIIFMRSGSLWAAPFDVRQLKTTGPEVPVINGVELAGLIGFAAYTFSNDGLLVYLPGGDVNGLSSALAGTGEDIGPRQLVWVDRQGKVTPLGVKANAFAQPRLSPDDKQVVLAVGPLGNSDIWTYDFSRGTLSKRTFKGNAVHPIWSRDGQHLIYTFVPNYEGLAWTRADGAGHAEKLVDAPRIIVPSSFTPDDTQLIFTEALTGPTSIHVLSMNGDHTDRILLKGNNEIQGALSPDGKWLAYEASETGRSEIYIRPFPDVNNGKWQISTNGGVEAIWRGDGKELFYRTLDTPVSIMAVLVETEPQFQVGTPVKLFSGDFSIIPTASVNYDVTTDGQRFLMMKDVHKSNKEKEDTYQQTNLVVVENWFEELKRLAPPAR